MAKPKPLKRGGKEEAEEKHGNQTDILLIMKRSHTDLQSSVSSFPPCFKGFWD